MCASRVSGRRKGATLIAAFSRAAIFPSVLSTELLLHVNGCPCLFSTDTCVLDGYTTKSVDDRVGYLNFATAGDAAPGRTGNFSTKHSSDHNIGEHNFRVVNNYVGGVKEEPYLQDDGTIRLAGASGITLEGYQRPERPLRLHRLTTA